MAVKKIAISLPETVVEAVDRLAAQHHLARSTFIARVLERVAARARDEDLRTAVDRLFEDGDIAAEQSRTAEQFGSVADWPEAAW
jgi:hypothetical protein